MKIIDRDLLLEFRMMHQCAWCKKPVEECDPAHIFSRGAGRLDLRENLVNLCRECHRNNHDGHSPNRAQLLQIAAKRERTTPGAIVQLIYDLRANTSEKVREVS